MAFTSQYGSSSSQYGNIEYASVPQAQAQTAFAVENIYAAFDYLTANSFLADCSPFVSALTLVYDTFTGTNGTDVASHTPDIDLTGNPWVAQNGAQTIQSNKAQYSSGTGIGALYTIDCGQANVSMSALVTPQNSNDNQGLVARYTDNNNFWFLEINISNNTNSGLWQRSGGAWFQRIAINPNLSAGVEYPAAWQCSGQTFTISINNSAPQNYSSASMNQTSTKHGIIAGNANETVDSYRMTSP